MFCVKAAVIVDVTEATFIDKFTEYHHQALQLPSVLPNVLVFFSSLFWFTGNNFTVIVKCQTIIIVGHCFWTDFFPGSQKEI